MAEGKSGKMIDLSHAVEHGMTTYKGLPAPRIYEFMSREESRDHYSDGITFHIGGIDMVANTGTYIDAPFHRYEGGLDLAGLDLHSVANLEGLVVDVTDRQGREITEPVLAGLKVEGRAVLVHTGWDQHWRTDQYFDGHPYLTEGAAAYLVDQQAALVGIDSLNIDGTDDGRRPAHSLLLEHQIPVVEHLCSLQDLPQVGFRFFAVPVKVAKLGSFPVRAFAIVDES